MSLVERLKVDTHRGFQAKPRYFSHGDYVTYFVEPDRCVARRLNSLVTVYTSTVSGNLVGCKVKGVKRLLKTLKSVCFVATDGKVVMGMLLLSAAAVEDEAKNEVLQLAETFGRAELPTEEIGNQAI